MFLVCTHWIRLLRIVAFCQYNEEFTTEYWIIHFDPDWIKTVTVIVYTKSMLMFNLFFKSAY